MRTAHPREQLGNRLICDSLAISYSRDIDGTIAEEDDGERTRDTREDDDDDDDDDEEVGTDQQDDEEEDAMSNGHAALLEQVVIGGQNRRSTSRSGRGKSRSVSPGTRAAAASQQLHHDYVNSAPGSRFLDDTTRSFGAGGSIPAIPPPPQSRFQKQQQQQQQQFFSVQPATVPTTGDSDPYGKEFDAIGSRVPATAAAANPPSTGSRINGRVIPSVAQQVRKELTAASIPPRLRNGYVPSGSGGV